MMHGGCCVITSLIQAFTMASELSALHVLVYDGEYEDPLHGSASLREINYVSSLGAFMKRNTEANGYVILSIHEGDAFIIKILQLVENVR